MGYLHDKMPFEFYYLLHIFLITKPTISYQVLELHSICNNRIEHISKHLILVYLASSLCIACLFISIHLIFFHYLIGKWNVQIISHVKEL